MLGSPTRKKKTFDESKVIARVAPEIINVPAMLAASLEPWQKFEQAF